MEDKWKVMMLKYWRPEGIISYRLFGYIVQLQAMKEIEAEEMVSNLEKLRQLYEEVVQFRDSPWMQSIATEEARADLQEIIAELSYAGCV